MFYLSHVANHEKAAIRKEVVEVAGLRIGASKSSLGAETVSSEPVFTSLTTPEVTFVLSPFLIYTRVQNEDF